jgi:hypothetical protein
VLPAGCSCRLEPPNTAKTLKGFVIHGYGVGVHYWPTGQVSVTKTNVYGNLEWYPSQAGGTITSETTVNNTMVCQSSVPSSARPTVKSTNGACAYWRPYTYNTDPAGNGFYAGLSWNNQSVYIGRGWANKEYVPGRLQIPAGIYAELNGAEASVTSPEYLVVAVNCTCEWVRASDALTRVGLVVTNDQTKDALVGLVQLANGLISISKVAKATMVMWYTNETGATVYAVPATRVLVCEDSSYQATTTTVAPKVTAAPVACREFFLNGFSLFFNFFNEFYDFLKFNYSF